MNLDTARETFYRTLEELRVLGELSSLAHWDQSVCMPAGGADSRADHHQLLSTLAHQRRVSGSFADSVEVLSSAAELSADDKLNVLRVKRQIDRAKKLPETFVSERARAHSLAQSAWVAAKPGSDFEAVKPHLQRILSLAKEEAELIGSPGARYNALLDAYEPHMTLEVIAPHFDRLGSELRKMVPAIEEAQRGPSKDSLKDSAKDTIACSIDLQQRLCRELVQTLGYRFDTGRLDTSAHPFQMTIGSGDVRITTRYDEADFLSSLHCSLHEAGHALYELSLPKSHRGTPLGSSVSLGVHESQSRFWENFIGRSVPFCRFLETFLRREGAESLAAAGAERLWQLMNRVEPSLIRVDADEVTYSLHIIIRLELETAMLDGQLEIDDLPGAWAERYRHYLGIEPEDHRQGVLQDIHWFIGALGYFPTYVLGNMFAAQLHRRLREEHPELDDLIGAGRFEAIRQWMHDKIAAHGQRYTSTELIERAVGEPLSAEPFLAYLRGKFGVS